MTLILSALSNIPIYFLFLFKCPVSVADRIERLQWDFLWQGREQSKKYHLVKWALVYKSKKEGGLGLDPLSYESSSFREMVVEDR